MGAETVEPSSAVAFEAMVTVMSLLLLFEILILEFPHRLI